MHDNSFQLQRQHQDVHVMIFIGFGFLMTFLKKYSYGAVGFNMLISAVGIQWSMLIYGWLHMSEHSKDDATVCLGNTATLPGLVYGY